MKKLIIQVLGLAGLTALCAYAGSSKPQPVRVGMVIGIKPDKITAYEALHAASNSGVRDLLAKYHMHNFSIYIHRLDDGKFYLFGYYEYTGTNYKADMDKLAMEPRNQQWLSVTDAMQIPASGKKSWAVMNEVYHNQ